MQTGLFLAFRENKFDRLNSNDQSLFNFTIIGCCWLPFRRFALISVKVQHKPLNLIYYMLLVFIECPLV